MSISFLDVDALNPYFDHLGVAPRVMGIGPSVAIPEVLSQAGITEEEVDLFEVTRLHNVSKRRLTTCDNR